MSGGNESLTGSAKSGGENAQKGPSTNPLWLTFTLLRRMRTHRHLVLSAFVWMFISSLAEVAPIGLAQYATRFLFSETHPSPPAPEITPLKAAFFGLIDPSHPPFLGILVIAVLILGLTSAVATYMASSKSRFVAAAVVASLRQDLMAQFLHLPMSWFTRKHKGDLLSRFTTDVEQTFVGINDFLTMIIHRFLTLGLAITAAFAINWQLAALSFVTLPVLALPLARVGRKTNRESRAGLEAMGRKTDAVIRSIDGVRTIRTHQAEQGELRRMALLSKAWLKNQESVIHHVSTGLGLMQLIYGVSIATALGLGGYLVATKSWGLTPVAFIGFLVALSLTFRPIRQIARAYSKWQVAMAAGARIEEILALNTTRSRSETGTMVGPLVDRVSLQNVGFAYDLSQPGTHTLCEVSLDIQRGMTAAIVGASGSGKSTIIDLILGFETPLVGQIFFDGHAIEDIAKSSLLSQMAVVSQNPFVLHASIRENIQLGLEPQSDAALFSATRTAQIHDHIAALPEGYETVIGGSEPILSGGELQRVAIARALLRPASILILDEATSQLDPESERAFLNALRSSSDGRATLIIAHRLSSIIDVDQIHVLADGRIVERGEHKKLLADAGVYARLFRSPQSA